METGLTHFDNQGNAIMVDVSAKDVTVRVAVAEGKIKVSSAVMDIIMNGTAAKGDVLGVARVAGIMAVKRTSELIPLCHSLALSHAAVDFEILNEPANMTDSPPQTPNCIKAICTVKLTGRTGAEMEALTGVSIALLTIYDMCKALDRGMVLSDIHLVEKSGGKSGHFIFDSGVTDKGA